VPQHDPFGRTACQTIPWSPLSRCLTYPECGSGASTVFGSYSAAAAMKVQQWAGVQFAQGIRTVPAGSLRFVDFSKPDAAPIASNASWTAATARNWPGRGTPSLPQR